MTINPDKIRQFLEDPRTVTWTAAELYYFASQGADHFSPGPGGILSLGTRCDGSGLPFVDGCCPACRAPFRQPGVHATPGSVDTAIYRVLRRGF